MEEKCENCRYSGQENRRNELKCLRHAPMPFNAVTFHVAEVIRDIAWIIHVKELGEEPDKYNDVAIEVTEANMYAVWPYVEKDEWCGDWAPKEIKKTLSSQEDSAQVVP